MRSLNIGLIAAVLVLALTFAAPAVAQQQSPSVGLAAQTDTGTRAYIPYDGTVENVNLTNGNLNLKIPLVHLPGRNGFDLDLNLEYDSKMWKNEAAYDAELGLLTSAWLEDVRNPYVAMGWHLNIPSIYETSLLLYDSTGVQYGCIGTTTVILGDGSRHNFSNNPGCSSPYEINVMDAEDNSGAILTLHTADGTVLALRNGTKIYFPGASTTATKMIDANGNTITFNAGSITDTLGRTVVLTGGGSGHDCALQQSGGLTGLSYTDSNGNPFTVSFGYTNQTVNWSFGMPYTDWHLQPPILVANRSGSCNRSMLTSLNVGGHVYSFDYLLSGNGELSKITYPSGGYTTYSYFPYDHLELSIDTGQQPPNDYYSITATFREVTQKQACTSANDCVTTTYTAGWTQANNSSMTITFPDGHKEVHNFTQEMIAGQGGETYHGLAAHETSVVTKSSSGTVLQTVTTTYSGTKAWDLPTTVQTKLDASGPTKKYTLQYDTFTANYLPWLDPWVQAQPQPTTVTRKIDNVSQRMDYDWGQSRLLRKTVTSYVHTLNGHDYFSAAIRLMNLPATTTTYDGAGNQKAQTQYVYDEPTLLSASGAPGHDDTNYSTNYVTRGLATQVQRWRNLPSSAWLVTSNTYDTVGNLRSSTDPGQHTTSYAWDDSWSGSNCLPSSNSYAYLTRVTNALSQQVSATSFPCTGRMQSFTDANNRVTSYTYDQFSRMLTRAAPDGGLVTNSFYDTPPVTVTTTAKITDSLNLVSLALVDGLGRLKQTQLTSDPEGTVSTDTTYDGLNRVVTLSNPYRSTGESTYGITTTNYDGL
ncbi:MAG TPA: hypothetical protein VMS96_11910, partial [Terriglobales bacterium]|nr:hypothetical protein [Terriglobales bacterium]